jgi:hypothetical protein
MDDVRSFILSIFFDYFYVCVCGSRLDKGAIKKRRKSRTKGCVRLYDGISWKMPSAPSQMPFDLFQQRLGLQATRWMGQGVLYGT